MKRTYPLFQQYIAYVLLISFLLQSCGGGFDSNPLIPIQKEQTALIQTNAQVTLPLTNIQPLVDKQLTAQGGHNVTIYEEAGELKANVAVNAPQGFSKTYEGLNVYIEQGAELSNLYRLDTKAQERRIHLQLAHGKSSSKVFIYKEAGLMGGDEIEENTRKLLKLASKKDTNFTRKKEILDSSRTLLELPPNTRANVNAQNDKGYAPLHLAVKRETQHINMELVQLYLDSGAHTDITDMNGYTPLHYAIKYGHYELAELLLTNGADVNAQTNLNLAPLHIAVNSDPLRIDLIRLLASQVGININIRRGGNQNTPLAILRINPKFNGYQEAEQILLAKGAAL